MCFKSSVLTNACLMKKDSYIAKGEEKIPLTKG